MAWQLGREQADEPLLWTARELRAIQSLSLAALSELPPDPSNRFADDPGAARLGRKLFFDAGLSANGRVSCASCHVPERAFQDDLPVGKGIGRTRRRTMPLAGVGNARWLFWDGRRDSLWAQALTPLESPVEHGITRAFAVRRIAERYRREYEAVFGALSHDVNEVFANLGKTIEAFERRLRPAPSRFDRFAAALAGGRDEEAASILTAAEARGLRLFVGRGRCTNCHSGPLFTNGEFHNTGVPQPRLDRGRADGARQVVRDPFNCLGRYSDARPADCTELRFIVLDGKQLLGAFKVPSLRGVGSRAPYMHAGQFRTLRRVLQHYRDAPRADVGASELKRLNLSDRELDELEQFLRTLAGAQ